MPTSFTLTRTVEIARPAAEAWAVVADYGRDTAWRQGVTAMVPSLPGPVTVGTTTAEELRFAGRTLRNDGVVTAVDPGRSFSWRTTSGAQAHGSRTVEALGPDRCRVRLELTVTPPRRERVLLPVLRRVLGATLAGDARRLAVLVESSTPDHLRPATAARTAG